MISIVAAGLFIFAVAELSVRVLLFPQWRDVSQTPFEFHPIYRTFQRANLDIRRFNPQNYDVRNTTNSRGFRDREAGFDQDLQNLWISGMSNSYAGFVEDDETYAAHLQTRYRYSNALLASEGHVLDDQIAVMRHMAAQNYKPKAVILELTLNNSLRLYTDIDALLSKPLVRPNVTNASHQLNGAVQFTQKVYESLAQVRDMDFVGVKARLIDNSALYVYSKVQLNNIPLLRDLMLRLGLRSDAALAMPVPISMFSKDGASTAGDDVILSTAHAVSSLDQWITRELGAKFGVVLIPSPQQRNRAWLKRYAQSQGVAPESIDPSRPYNLLATQLRDRGIHVLTPTDVLDDVDPPLNFPDDGHLNARGHALLAGAIAAWLKSDLSLMPDKP